MKFAHYILLLLLVAACGGKSESDESILAQVDDRKMTMDDLNAVDPEQALTSEERAAVIESWIDREVLFKIAEERGITSDSRVERDIFEARAQILLTELGASLRREAADDTAARHALNSKIVETKKRLSIKSYPWRAR